MSAVEHGEDQHRPSSGLVDCPAVTTGWHGGWTGRPPSAPVGTTVRHPARSRGHSGARSGAVCVPYFPPRPARGTDHAAHMPLTSTVTPTWASDGGQWRTRVAKKLAKIHCWRTTANGGELSGPYPVCATTKPHLLWWGLLFSRILAHLCTYTKRPGINQEMDANDEGRCPLHNTNAGRLCIADLCGEEHRPDAGRHGGVAPAIPSAPAGVASD
jgi:hypothetical protein